MRGGQTANVNPVAKSQEGPERSKIQARERGVWHGGPMSENNGAEGESPKVDTAAVVEEITEGLATPVEGQGDQTSTMLWSPRKHAGHNRPLD